MRNRRLYTLLLALLLLAWALPGILQAAPPTPTPNQVDAVAKELWCPLCNGVRLDNCDLQACVQMKQVIAQKLAAGETKDQIRTYFVQQYGDVVTGVPNNQGFNLVAWYLPVIAAIVGIAILAYLVYTYVRRRPAAQPARASDPAPGSANGNSNSNANESDYMRRVDEELKKYE
jgi:cytochrome c-type biogenesis protein CcmH